VLHIQAPGRCCWPRRLRPCRVAWSFPGFPTCGESLCMRILFSEAKTSETSIALGMELVSICIPLHMVGKWRRLFRWYNALFATAAGPRIPLGHIPQNLGAAFGRSRSRRRHNELWIPNHTWSREHGEFPGLSTLPRERLQDFQCAMLGICREQVFDSGREFLCQRCRWCGCGRSRRSRLRLSPLPSHPGPCSYASHEYILVRFHHMC